MMKDCKNHVAHPLKLLRIKGGKLAHFRIQKISITDETSCLSISDRFNRGQRSFVDFGFQSIFKKWSNCLLCWLISLECRPFGLLKPRNSNFPAHRLNQTPFPHNTGTEKRFIYNPQNTNSLLQGWLFPIFKTNVTCLRGEAYPNNTRSHLRCLITATLIAQRPLPSCRARVLLMLVAQIQCKQQF